MGNHEYCTECGLNDFHYGQPCPQWAYEKHQAEKQRIQNYNRRATKAAEELADKIRKTFNVEVEIQDFGLKIYKYQLVDFPSCGVGSYCGKPNEICICDPPDYLGSGDGGLG